MIQAGALAQAFAEWRLLPHGHPTVLQGFPQQRTPEEAAGRGHLHEVTQEGMEILEGREFPDPNRFWRSIYWGMRLPMGSTPLPMRRSLDTRSSPFAQERSCPVH